MALHCDVLDPRATWCPRELCLVDGCARSVLNETTGETVYFSVSGHEYKQLWQIIPALKPLYFSFENDFDPRGAMALVTDMFPHIVVLCAVYVLFVFYGNRLVAKPLELRGALIGWNALLSIFSFIGAVRTVPHLIANVVDHGLEYTMCHAAEMAFGSGATGLWTALFILSKVPELIDTVFLVLRKRDVIFLHWYHHISVLLYAWSAYATRSSAGLWFIAMNYSVHAIMYGYYGARAAGYKLNWLAPVVTAMQISQMFVGILVCVAVPWYQFVEGHTCDMTRMAFASGLIMYGSYFFLFVVFAIQRYCSSKPKRE